MPRFLVVPRMLFPFRLVSDSLKNHVVCESYRSLWYTGRQSGIGHDRCENYAYWFLLFWDIWRNFRSRRYQKDMPFSRRTGQHSVHQAVFEMQRLCTVILYQSEISVQQDNSGMICFLKGLDYQICIGSGWYIPRDNFSRKRSIMIQR